MRELSWQEFSNSINKASKCFCYSGEGARMALNGFVISFFEFQQPLQNRVPRVQVLLPLPKETV